MEKKTHLRILVSCHEGIIRL